VRRIGATCLAFLAAGAAAIAEPPRLTLAPCDVPGLEVKAKCGTLEVWEDRASAKGRRIGLKIVVIPASGPERVNDPYVYLSGGPGSASTEEAAFLAADFAKIREKRDLLFVDQRGTGGSHPLSCALFLPPGDLQAALGAFFPLESVRKCRSALEKDADLKLYTTAMAADDLEEVRVALGYDRLNLLGGSYGTRAAQVFLRRHPASVRTVTLQGVVPMNEPMPLHIPPWSERALRGVLAECAGEAACHAAFPDLDAEMDRVFAGLARAPVKTRVLNPQTAEPTEVSLSRDLAAEGIRYMLYTSGSAGDVPVVVHQAARGDFTPIAESALFGRLEIVDSGSNGLYLSITCAEDLPWFQPEEAERLAAGTFIGNYRWQQQKAACELWPRGPVPEGFQELVHASAPVLLVSGMWDPATPPANAEQVAKGLPNSLSIVVPHGGHGYDGLEGLDCLTELEAEFVRSGSVQGLDTACVQRIRRPPFRTEPLDLAVIALPESDLARFRGSYVAEGGPIEGSVELIGGKLKMTVGSDRPLLLAPVAPTRFRVAAAPGVVVEFALAGDAVVSATILQSGQQVLKLVPRPGAKKDASR